MPRLDTWTRVNCLPVDRALVPLMCLQAVFFAPWLPPSSSYEVSRFSMWLMALDNVLDDPDADDEDLSVRIGNWRRMLESGQIGRASCRERV